MKTRKVIYCAVTILLSIFISIAVVACGTSEEGGGGDITTGDSVLPDKTIFWLGSSVVYGSQAGGYSMADKLAADNNWKCVKEAVSGTTLFASENELTYSKSYIERLVNGNSFSKDEKIDAFICQISTNDAKSANKSKWGDVTEDAITEQNAFDRYTTYGAVEFIITYVKQIWDCPIYFFSGSYFGDTGLRSYSSVWGTTYADLISGVKSIVSKWDNKNGYDVNIIDLFNDEKFNSISDEQYQEYMADAVHPNKTGYSAWWTPYFNTVLKNDLL